MPHHRWRIAAAAIALHLCIGAVYAYSVLVKPLQDLHGWTRPETALAFSIAIVFLGLSAAVFGRTVERRGARWSALVAMACWVTGLLGTALAFQIGSKALFYASYGVIGGIGLGFGYLAPVSLLVRSFPDRRGLATGMAIMGFGLGALVFGPSMTALAQVTTLPMTFMLLAGATLLIMGTAALAFGPHQAPPAKASVGEDPVPAPRTLRFWCLWLMLFLNVSAGIALISAAAPLLQEQAGFSAAAATGIVGLLGLFNGGGRLGWSALSDRVGRANVWTGFFLVGALCFAVMATVTAPAVFLACFLLAITCYGGGFACMPSYIADLFGVDRLPRIQGLVLTAWSAAGIVGPVIAATVRERAGSYAASLPVFSALLVAGLVVVVVLRLALARRPAVAVA